MSKTYLATLQRVIDGDTSVVTVDLGLGVSKTEHIRLHGCNCPERNAHIMGERATATAAAWWSTHNNTAYITTDGHRDRYGRLLATIVPAPRSRDSLCRHLIAAHVCTPRPTDP